MWALLAIVFWALFLIILVWSARTPQPRMALAGAGGIPAFSSLPAGGTQALGSFSASLGVHLVILVCLPHLPSLWSSSTPNRVRARLIPPAQAALILHLPERVYVVATVAPPAEPRPKAAPARPRPAPRRTSVTPASHIANRRLLPVPSVLLQPNRPVAADLRSFQLPSFLYWSPPRTPPPPGPIKPGSAGAEKSSASAARNNAVTPPNAEHRSAPISVASAPRTSPQALPLPPAATAGPWSLIAHGSNPEELEGLAHRIEGELVALGSSSTSQPHRSENVEIPPLNQPSVPPPAPPDASPAAPASAPQTVARAPTPVAPAAGGSAPPGNSGSRPDPTPSVRILNTRAGPVEVRQLSDGSEQWRFPSTGSFDVVIVQHAAGSMIPEAGPFLTGWPVQTVFLALGTAKDWVMQYCLPPSAGAPASQSGMVVTLGKPGKLEAPFIQLALLPPPKIAGGPRPALFYGTLGSDGRFRHLRPIAAPDYDTRAELLPYIEQWQFRPAKWDGASAEVDVVLLVPASPGG
ncbi:MAG: hypothetical protein ACLQBJ_15420 [Bryobacteraceae bacterium]